MLTTCHREKYQLRNDFVVIISENGNYVGSGGKIMFISHGLTIPHIISHHSVTEHLHRVSTIASTSNITKVILHLHRFRRSYEQQQLAPQSTT